MGCVLVTLGRAEAMSAGQGQDSEKARRREEEG